jgi:1-deoxy-D-xylulose-5-phosphate synthase
VIRYPKGPLPEPLPAIDTLEGVDVLARHPADGPSVLVIGIGPMAHTAVAAAGLLAARGLACTVVSPGWALPLPAALVKLAGDHDHVVCVEDGLVDGGIGSLIAQRCTDAGLATPVQTLGIPLAFLPHASRDELLESLRLGAEHVAADVLTQVARFQR